MKWEGNRQSDNVEDMRDGEGSGGGSAGGGFSVGGRGLGVGGIVVALLASWMFGINPLTVLNLLGGVEGGVTTQSGQSAQVPRPAPRASANDTMTQFVRTVLADTEDVWREQFRLAGGTYRDPKLALFRGSVPTACGQGQSAMGPFYCPGDQKVYIDLGFYEVMKTRLGAPGDFAQAYVIAHEVGHHVQNLMGISGKVDAMRGRVSQAKQNALSVRLELQADCFAGVWAFHAQAARQILEQGDVEEALNAATQIGDDTLQRKSQGTVVPESFTHGSSAQRVAWFTQGLKTGQIAQCNTFEAKQL
nr:neutral zinc metallopeptidase [uncultured Roseateles sp.]